MTSCQDLDVISKEDLGGLISRHFGLREDLKNFKRILRNNCVELVVNNGSRGYIFFGRSSQSRTHTTRAEEERKKYETNWTRVVYYFTDNETEIAGFSWRK